MLRTLLALALVLPVAGCNSTDPIVDDMPTVSFAEAEQAADEGTTEVGVRVQLAGTAADAVSVEVALDEAAGTADAADLSGFSAATVTFPAGSTSGATETVTLTASADNLAEDDEAAVFVLRNPTGAALGVPARLTLTLGDVFDPDAVDYDAIENPQFAQDVQPLLAARCGDCHGGADPAAGLDVTSWSGLVAGSDFGEALVAYDSENSLMIELMTKLPADHPAYGAHQLPESEVDFLKRWIEQGAQSADGDVPYAGNRGRAYVCNQMAGQVSIIDLDNLVVARNVSFEAYGMPMATNPHDVDVEPDGSAWYVSLINANRVLKYDAATNEVIAEALLSSTFKPGMLAVNPENGFLFAGRSFSDPSDTPSVYAIERTGMVATEVPVVSSRPHPIAVTNDGDYLLSGSLADNKIASFDLSDIEDIEQADVLTVPGEPKAFVHYAVSPDGNVAALTSQLSQELYFIDISDPENLAVLSVVTVGEQPWHPTYSPDGSRVYVPNRLSDNVSVVDASDPAAPSVAAPISDPAFSMPHGSGITDDGRYLFVSSRNMEGGYTPRYPFGDNATAGNVAVIDTQTLEVVKVLEVEEFASGIAVYQP